MTMANTKEKQRQLQLENPDPKTTTATTTPQQNGTLLPRPVAGLVSLFAQSTSLSVRAGTSLFGLAIDTARTSTLTGLELSRGLIESILVRAGKDVALRGSEYGRAETESLVERSLAVLHSTITSASFFASAGFRVSSTTLVSLSAMSQNLLSALDSILGSTESSRAIAAIITLIRREFRTSENTGLGDLGEKPGIQDLVIGTVGFALLQRWGRRATEREVRAHGVQEVIWDIVILDNGIRADVVGLGAEPSVNHAPPQPIKHARSMSAMTPSQTSFLSAVDADDDEDISAIKREQRTSNPSTTAWVPREYYTELSDDDICRHIRAQLPKGAYLSLKTETTVSRTIVADIYDDHDISIEPPPGTAVVAEEFHQRTNGTASNSKIPTHTVAFKNVSRPSCDSNTLRPISQDRNNNLRIEYEGKKVLPDNHCVHAGPAPICISNEDSHPLPRVGNPSSLVNPLVRLTKKTRSRSDDFRFRASSSGKKSSRGPYFSIFEDSPDSHLSHTGDHSSRPATPAKRHRRRQRSSSKTSSSFYENDASTTPYKPLDSEFLPQDDYMGATAPSSLYPYGAAPHQQTSVMLTPRYIHGVHHDQAAVSQLMHYGRIPGSFPGNHLAKNLKRFCRLATSSYGSNFLRMVGIPPAEPSSPRVEDLRDDRILDEHHSFCYHTGLPASTILLSSFVDSAGGSNSEGRTVEGFPLVHFLTLDHESKAVVLTLRGTWGFEDVLTDMMCDYDDMFWLGKKWQVHKGMHASACRILEGGGGRVMATIKAALRDFPNYGVIFCGHSLGGGVAALLATLISKPKDPGQPESSFVTSAAQYPTRGNSGLRGSRDTKMPVEYCLPPGRPIHVYAYGPPAVMSADLRQATRGLVTTVVNGQDVVPSLSLGILRDFRAISLAFRNDISHTRQHIKNRIWETITHSLLNHKMYTTNQLPLPIMPADDVDEDSWAWSTLKALRDKSMVEVKLVPPGEVFVVETMRVLQRDAFASDTARESDTYPRLGRPATRVQLKFVRDVEKRFQELRFGSGMLADHSPARYEASLAVLSRGVLED